MRDKHHHSRGTDLPNAGATDLTEVRTLQDVVRRARLKKRRRALLGSHLAVSIACLPLILFARDSPLLALKYAGLLLFANAVVWVSMREGHSGTEPEVQTDLCRTERGAIEPRELDERELAVQRSLAQAARVLKNCYRASVWAMFGTVIGAVGGTWLASLLDLPLPFLVGAAFVAGGMLTLSALEVRGNSAADQAARLIETASVETSGAIVDFIRASDPRFHERAQGSLIRLLKRMRPTDGAALTADQRKHLYALLRPVCARQQPKLALAILGLVEQLGDRSAQPYLDALLAMDDPKPGDDEELLRAAYYAVQSLNEADAQLTMRGTLLSPSQSPSAAAETLLRPNGPAGTEAPEQLLRTTASDADTRGRDP